MPISTISVSNVIFNPRRLLDLFSGTGSVGSVYREKGWQVVSLDNDPRWKPEICCDIRMWSFRDLPQGYFDVIFAAPPCTEYSTSKTTKERNIAEANSLVMCVLEIIDFFQPTRWMIENPRNGLLKRQSFMQHLPWVDVDFCQFGTFGYQKPTRIWGSPQIAALSDVLCDGITCPNLIPGSRKHKLRLEEEGVTKLEKYRIPRLLIMYLQGWIDGKEVSRQNFLPEQSKAEQSTQTAWPGPLPAKSEPTLTDSDRDPAGDVDFFSVSSTANSPRILSVSEQVISKTDSSDTFSPLSATSSIFENPDDLSLTSVPVSPKTHAEKCCYHSMQIPERLLQPGSSFKVNTVISCAPHVFQLLLQIPCVTPSQTKIMLDVLIDTGAQANLVRRGLFSNNEFFPAKNPISMVTAGGSPLEGGREQVRLVLVFNASPPGRPDFSRRWKETAIFYDANITVDAILSYPWLRDRHLGVVPHLDALCHFNSDGQTSKILRSPISTSNNASRAICVISTCPTSAEHLPTSVQETGFFTHDPYSSENFLPPPSADLVSSPVFHVETDSRRIRYRQRQINCGKATDGYARYVIRVPLISRETDNPFHPVTPRLEKKCSKRQWDQELQRWRHALHKWDFSSTKGLPNSSSSGSSMNVPKPTLTSSSEKNCASSTVSVIPIISSADSHQQVPPRRLMDLGGGRKPFESYQVKQPIFRGILSQLGVSEPAVDAFGEAALHLCQIWWGPEGEKEDAFQVTDWSEHGLLWCNPPFSRLQEVVCKILRDKARVVLIVPHWPNRSWFKKLRPFVLRKVWIKRGTKLFETTVGDLPGIPWSVLAMHIDASLQRDIRQIDFQENLKPDVDSLRQSILADFNDKVFRSQIFPDPPVRGPHGYATIELRPGSEPVKQRPIHLHGQRWDDMCRVTDMWIDRHLVEEGTGPWSSPAFTVAKRGGKVRGVVDFRALNSVTVGDGYPMPRIRDILVRQGKMKVFSTLDLKDAFHQIPMHPDSRSLTCTSTPRGSVQWRVLAQGLKNGPQIFQRIVEHVLAGEKHADPYFDDILVGSTGATIQEAIVNHDRDVRHTLELLAENRLVADPAKCKLFLREVEFCGHILGNDLIRPAPGKLKAVQLWEKPPHVTALRSFLGLCNYYSHFIPNFAALAGPLQDMLHGSKQEMRKGSHKPLEWTAERETAFFNLRKTLSDQLELLSFDPDRPFILRTDASDYAVGAVLEQMIDFPEKPSLEILAGAKTKPCAFFSRKLTAGQAKRWPVEEKETYAVVCALEKYASVIGLQPVLILTDHRTLESWQKRAMDTPSGMSGRRARWHERLSRFDLQVQYVPGASNTIADGMSRWAYPASKAYADISIHGDAETDQEARKIIEEERLEDAQFPAPGNSVSVSVVTRSGRILDPCATDSELPKIPSLSSGSQLNVTSAEPPILLTGETNLNSGDLSLISSERDGPANSMPTNLTLSSSLTEKGAMMEDWSCYYSTDPTWKNWWKTVHDSTEEWPDGVQLQGNKLIWNGKECVPCDLTARLLRELHSVLGHPGQKKLWTVANLRYHWSCGVEVRKISDDISRQCYVCQSCSDPNFSVQGQMVPTPIPPRLGESVALDIVYLPATEWKEKEFDCAVVAVDRLSGWMIAIPSKRLGLKAKDVAEEMYHHWWSFMGVPAVVTSDQGPQFAGAWWKTLCALQGIRNCQGQAYHHCSNGRAEAAVKQLEHVLKRLISDDHLNWVELLPRALQRIHDLPGPTGYSPYEVVFGRDRVCGGVPRPVEREAPDAVEFFERMQKIDQAVAEKLEKLHRRDMDQRNKKRPEKPQYEIGSWVWVMRPREDHLAAAKLIPRWFLAQIIRREGHDSYVVRVRPHGPERAVHVNQLKIFVPDPLFGDPVELIFERQLSPEDAVREVGEFDVEQIIRHRPPSCSPNKEWNFLVKWRGYPEEEATWENVSAFLPQFCSPWRDYCKSHGILGEITQHLRAESSSA